MQETLRYLPILAISLLIGALVLSSGSKVLGNFRDDFVSALDSNSVVNESQTASGVIITPTYSSGAIVRSVSNVYINHSGPFLGVAIGAQANASTGIHGNGKITLSGNYSNNKTLIVYQYSTKDATLNASVDTLTANVEISKQFSTIGIIAAMVIILMLIGGLAAYFYLV